MVDLRPSATGNIWKMISSAAPTADQRLFQRRFRDRIAEPHRDQGREYIAHRRTVCRHRAIIEFRIEVPGVERTADEHLPGAEHQRRAEHDEGEPEMGEDETLVNQ